MMSDKLSNRLADQEFDLQKGTASRPSFSLGHIPWPIRLSIVASVLLLGWSFASPMRRGILSDSGGNRVRQASRGQDAFDRDFNAFEPSGRDNRTMDIPTPMNAEENARIVEQAREADQRLLARIRESTRDSRQAGQAVPGRDEAISHYKRYKDRVLHHMQVAESDGGHIPDQFREQLEKQLQDRP